MKHGFGERIRSEMKAQGFSEQMVSEAIGSAKHTYNNWLNERSEPSFTHLKRISGFLQVSLHWVLTGEGPIDLPTKGNGKPSEYRKQLRSQRREENEREIAKLDLERRARKLQAEVDAFNATVQPEDHIDLEGQK